MPDSMREQIFAYLKNRYGSDPEYLFFTRHKHNRDDWIEQSYSDLMYDYSLNVDYYYEVIYENSSYICYRKRDL